MRKRIFKKSFSFHSFSIRMILLAGFFVVAVGAVSGKFFILQISGYEYWKGKALAQQMQIVQTQPDRGDIFVQDKDGGLHAVAVIKRLFDISVNPSKLVGSPADHARILADMLSLSYADVLQKLSKQNDPYEALARGVSQATAETLAAKKIQGLTIQERKARYYPLGSFASHVIGFVGSDAAGNLSGQYGVELKYDDVLRGAGPTQQNIQALVEKGSFLGAHDLYLENGAVLILTIDPNIQAEAERDLRDEAQKWNAKGGNVIVLDSKTGAIRAFANYPAFDLNAYGKVKDLSIFLNSGTSLRYEPGSVFKPFTLAAGLTQGSITPDTQYFDSGVIRIGNNVIHNAGNSAPNKWISMALFLQRSYNLGAVFIERTIGNAYFSDFLVKTLHFEDKTNVDLPQEINSSFANLKAKDAVDIDFATAAFGQGIAVTPIKLIQMFSAFTNHGIVMQPYIVDAIKRADGSVQATIPKQLGQMISSSVVDKEVPLLESVVSGERGSGMLARIAGYRIAGKTGTGDIANENGTGYTNRVNHTFVGFGPVTDPRFVILTRLEEPQGVRYAETTAVPLFKKIMKFALEYYGIPPDAQISPTP
ncbi:MAG: hypothetical protein COX12_01150 [Candidatus Brennerbacteria bacterium CG23_combo_of_CG06-09_8_20_14_all_44_41]|uniref:Penicillin-binding protein 2 n=2 Tax=Candidatus Brenneribacteriota TaxID=1817902 RepID=A0A2M8C3R5_9BACT|nr:MAG: hypothetical protein AUJ43_02670 [Parcubacteria group bacterium CG1_02_44_31]PIP50459.1 MAG: hypothetical protein COX12_01150 [Candidatus Brennerbacteria bacterium CG23_combo_of_CG06-09_8_20_14_all_44_41]PIX28928.1 MAG: hypothetical protein COZ64_01560 [Candidatus Brennerbacteria bacterium CG_4_8_14_3_um_filter_43_14]PJB50735.1 MAG: hypothetical protein CO102_00175 [Candidatus Brennerbacteria bacterium CG_4_9_14_3_um_filter_43_9]